MPLTVAPAAILESVPSFRPPLVAMVVLTIRQIAPCVDRDANAIRECILPPSTSIESEAAHTGGSKSQPTVKEDALALWRPTKHAQAEYCPNSAEPRL